MICLVVDRQHLAKTRGTRRFTLRIAVLYQIKKMKLKFVSTFSSTPRAVTIPNITDSFASDCSDCIDCGQRTVGRRFVVRGTRADHRERAQTQQRGRDQVVQQVDGRRWRLQLPVRDEQRHFAERGWRRRCLCPRLGHMDRTVGRAVIIDLVCRPGWLPCRRIPFADIAAHPAGHTTGARASGDEAAQHR